MTKKKAVTFTNNNQSCVEGGGDYLTELDKIIDEMNKKVVSPSLRLLLSLHRKDNEAIHKLQYFPDMHVEDLESQFMEIEKEKKKIYDAAPELKHVPQRSEMEEEDGEDMEAFIRKRNQKRELAIISETMKKNKLTFCHYFCEGEVEFMKKNVNKKDECKFYKLTHTSQFDPFCTRGEEFHFKIASHFLSSVQPDYRAQEVTYVCNPYNVKKFNEKKRELAKRHGFMLESMKPLVLFHGNRTESNYDNIMKTNFSISKVGSNTGKFSQLIVY